jgi:ribosome-binding factor A
MPQGSRPARVADQIRAELSELLARHVKDPGLGFVTVTRVTVTPDLQLARVFYTALGDERARRATERALERARPFLRRHIGQRVRLRRVPELHFLFDTSVERQERIERILDDLRQAAVRDDEARDDDTGDA